MVNEFGLRVCAALKLDPALVSGVRIDASVGNRTVAVVTFPLSNAQIERLLFEDPNR